MPGAIKATANGGIMVEKAEEAVVVIPDESGSSDAISKSEAGAPSPGKKLTVSGTEFDISEELAVALEGRETDFNRKLSENSEELGLLRREKADREAKVVEKVSKEEESGLVDLIFEGEEKFTSALKKMINEAVTEKATAVESKISAKQQQDNFWDSFYKKHKELSKETHGYLIGSILNRNLEAWSSLPAEQAMEKLAEEAKRAFGIKQKPSSTKVKADGSLAAEAPSYGYDSKSPTPAPEEKGKSLGSVIRARKLERK